MRPALIGSVVRKQRNETAQYNNTTSQIINGKSSHITKNNNNTQNHQNLKDSQITTNNLSVMNSSEDKFLMDTEKMKKFTSVSVPDDGDKNEEFEGPTEPYSAFSYALLLSIPTTLLIWFLRVYFGHPDTLKDND